MTPQASKKDYEIYGHLGMSANQYVSVHNWVKKTMAKLTDVITVIEKNANRYEWSNISKQYVRDRSDWQMLCTTCHRIFDYTNEQRAAISLRSSKPVRQLTRDGEVIAEFHSISAAASVLGILRTSITNHLSGVTKSAGGFVWQI